MWNWRRNNKCLQELYFGNIHSIFKNNKALGADGGAIFLEDESSLESDSCHFLGNTAALGGGAVTVDHSSYTDTGSIFANNSTADNGKFTIAFWKSVLYFELHMIIYHFKFKSLILFRLSHSCTWSQYLDFY